jgi:hypothetical protein
MEKIGAAYCAVNVQICRTNSKMGRNALQVAHGVVRKDLAMAIVFKGLAQSVK